MSDNGLAAMAGCLLVAGAVIGGLIIVSGLLAALPGADMLMAIAVLLLVPATLGLIAFLAALGRSS